jgi:hypothetical protein
MKAIHQFKLEEWFMGFRISVLFFTVAALAGYQSASAQANHKFNGYDLVDKTGNIRKPTDVRDLYQFLGTYTPTGSNGDTEMHVTYASPGAAQYYRKNGKFADGTVLVKETFTTDHAQLTTGDARWATNKTIVWFVMIKDAKNRFPNNSLWGNGWGWALFKADAPDKQVATNFKKDCLGCHVPAQSTDWLYVQGYPVLKSK